MTGVQTCALPIFFKDGKPVVISHFTAKGTDLGSRLEQLRNKIIELINEYEIDEVVFEDI